MKEIQKNLLYHLLTLLQVIADVSRETLIQKREGGNPLFKFHCFLLLSTNFDLISCINACTHQYLYTA